MPRASAGVSTSTPKPYEQLDEKVKAARRRASAKYRAKHAEAELEKQRARMAALRAERKSDPSLNAEERTRVKLANAAYRQSHAAQISEYDRARRDRAYERKHGYEAYGRRVAKVTLAGEVVDHVCKDNTEWIALRALKEDPYKRDFACLVEHLEDLRERSGIQHSVEGHRWVTLAGSNSPATIKVYLTSLTRREAQPWPEPASWLAPWENDPTSIIQCGATLCCVVNLLRATSKVEEQGAMSWKVDWLLKAEFACRLYNTAPAAPKRESVSMQLWLQCKQLPGRYIPFRDDLPVRHVVDDE
uniref:Uncharacterized protein n=1 Tax=Mycena chlorophos TaxID=658473 RepID=A0ABQ0KY75_MYCCL|nr:predicted protein [Mycena chlorophos]